MPSPAVASRKQGATPPGTSQQSLSGHLCVFFSGAADKPREVRRFAPQSPAHAGRVARSSSRQITAHSLELVRCSHSARLARPSFPAKDASIKSHKYLYLYAVLGPSRHVLRRAKSRASCPLPGPRATPARTAQNVHPEGGLRLTPRCTVCSGADRAALILANLHRAPVPRFPGRVRFGPPREGVQLRQRTPQLHTQSHAPRLTPSPPRVRGGLGAAR